MFEQDVVIVGGGLVGCWVVLEIKCLVFDIKVAIVVKIYFICFYFVVVQGGIVVSLKNVDVEDFWEVYVFDMVKGLDYLVDQDVVEIFIKEVLEVIIELEYLGVFFFCLLDGKIVQWVFGGYFYNCICYVVDKIGYVILYEFVNNLCCNKVEIYDEWYVMKFIYEEGEVKGLVMYEIVIGCIEIV